MARLHGRESKNWDIRGNLFLQGTKITASGTEINIMDGVVATAAEINILDGVVATAAEINRACDDSSRIVNNTSATLALTAASHDKKIITMNIAATTAVTLPEATGAGVKFTLVYLTTATGDHTITTADTTNAYYVGSAYLEDTTTELVGTFFPAATDDIITMNGSTTGGLIGQVVELTDVATDKWLVRMVAGNASATPATPFSGT